MKKLMLLPILGLAMALLFSCQNESEKPVIESEEVSQEVLDKLNALGFNTLNFDVIKYGNSLIVENDIALEINELDDMVNAKAVAAAEQYSTDNLVERLPRTINVFVSTRFRSQYAQATDIALARYNDENLELTFQRVTSSSQADIRIEPSPFWYGFFGILGSAGFPTNGGEPFNRILLTTSFYDNVTDLGELTTTIAHEMGHCLGFRHTDYADRSFSCGGGTSNEGDGGVGANFIPGTNPNADPDSWMLACSDGTDRPFNDNDKIALKFLY